MSILEIRHFHLFCGLGGGARGFNRGQARVGTMQAKFRCLGGIDVDPASIADFGRLAGVPGTCMDLFDRSQYLAFHGKEPPADWREATPQDIQRAAGGERPHIVFLSAPCKGFSGLLSETKSRSDKYQALNRLTVRGIWLMLEAWADDPPELIVFENVPRIANRGRALLDRITTVLRQYGYVTAETTHDCGELGGLAQSRKRFLLVARHAEKVPAFLYEPDKRPLRAVGEVLGKLPLPGDPAAGPMHRIPALQWKTWVRLAFVEAGSDWRSLNKLSVVDGKLADYLIVPEMFHGALGVTPWEDPAGTVTSNGRPASGTFSVADPRFDDKGGDYGQYGVCGWQDPMGAVINVKSPGQGMFAVQDPRMPESKNRQNGLYRVARWDRPTLAITGANHVAGAAQSVADPRGGPNPDTLHGKYHITPWNEPAHAVIAGNANGAFAVADPRPNIRHSRSRREDNYLTGGHYGVVPWNDHANVVSGRGRYDNGFNSVADPRIDILPAAADKLVAVIRALDGTWHRPFTTLDLAALQSLVDPEEHWSPDPLLQREIARFDAHNLGVSLNVFRLAGESDQSWRERIGNAVPPDAAAAIAGVMGTTLLLAWSGETFKLSAQAIWVQPIAIALAVRQP